MLSERSLFSFCFDLTVLSFGFSFHFPNIALTKLFDHSKRYAALPAPIFDLAVSAAAVANRPPIMPAQLDCYVLGEACCLLCC